MFYIMVRTRVAISPTGYPHIGTIYQALFDYAFAKRHAGKFIVRIEDTDKNRLVLDAEKKIFQALDWFGLQEDESVRTNGRYGPYRQSERLEIYKKYAQELVQKGYAYFCFCPKERLEKIRDQMQKANKVPMYDKCCRNLKTQISCLAGRQAKLKSGTEYVIRLKVPENRKIIIKDLIRGEIVFDSNGVDDQVLLKSDGFPTYFLAVVVDDHLMKITHMARGEEWLSSAPKIKLLYEFFDWEEPIFIHTPIIRNPDKSKFSKRQGHTSVSWYQEQGFLPEAILNYLALMGWSHPQSKDIFSLREFIKLFDFKDIKVVGPVFDLKKLEWMNGEYIRKSQIENLKSQIYNFYNKQYPQELITKTIPLIRERIKKLSDYLPLCEFFFRPPQTFEIELKNKKSVFNKIHQELKKNNRWQAVIIGDVMQNLAKTLGIKTGEFFMFLRVAITGKKISPPLNESMEILGKEECLNRIEKLTDR